MQVLDLMIPATVTTDEAGTETARSYVAAAVKEQDKVLHHSSLIRWPMCWMTDTRTPADKTHFNTMVKQQGQEAIATNEAQRAKPVLEAYASIISFALAHHRANQA